MPELTPSQTVGPFLGIGLINGPITPNVVAYDRPGSVSLQGLLLDGAGEPVPDGLIEVWQACPSGRYPHAADAREDPPLETGFSGFARSGTAPDGRYDLTVVKPGRVPWPGGGLQAPHLLIGVFARGLLKRAVTRCYFPDEAVANAEDPVLTRLEPAAAATLIATRGTDCLRFDIRLQGAGHTTFFAL